MSAIVGLNKDLTVTRAQGPDGLNSAFDKVNLIDSFGPSLRRHSDEGVSGGGTSPAVPEEVARYIEQLKDWNDAAPWAAAEALVSIGAPAVPALCGALKDKNVNIRQAAAEALGQIKDPRAVESLIGALKDEDWFVRATAAGALGEIKDPSAVPALLAALRDKDGDVGGWAAWALGQIKDPSAVPALCEALRDEKWQVRPMAAGALGKIKDPSAVPPLIETLKDKNEYVRGAAAWALGEIGDRIAITPLKEQLECEPADSVREYLTDAIKKLEGN